MAKRFTDTEKFSDTWYRKLSLLHKVIWEYLLAECNHAGILENFDLEMMSFKIGAEVTMEDLEKFENRIIFISDSVLYIPKFIDFQYGTLNAQSKVHASVLRELEKYKINTLSIEYTKSINTLKDKNKNKDKDKEIDIKLYGEYLNVSLNKEQYGKLLTMCASEKLLNELIDSFSINIEVGKERPYQTDLPNAHFERIKSYYNWRKKNPEKFAKECSRPDTKTYKPEVIVETAEEKARAEAIIAETKAKRFRRVS
jgi:hypothetical protein